MSDTALIVIDVQESFRHAPYWSDADVPTFIGHLQALIDGAEAQGVPVLQVFHTAPAGPFSTASGPTPCSTRRSTARSSAPGSIRG